MGSSASAKAGAGSARSVALVDAFRSSGRSLAFVGHGVPSLGPPICARWAPALRHRRQPATNGRVGALSCVESGAPTSADHLWPKHGPLLGQTIRWRPPSVRVYPTEAPGRDAESASIGLARVFRDGRVERPSRLLKKGLAARLGS